MVANEEVTHIILNYFLEHPDVADSLEGLVRWRLLDAFIEYRVRETAAVVVDLVQRGYVIEEEGPSQQKTYRLNRERAEAARALLLREASNAAKGS